MKRTAITRAILAAAVAVAITVAIPRAAAGGNSVEGFHKLKCVETPAARSAYASSGCRLIEGRAASQSAYEGHPRPVLLDSVRP